ncbi:MAG: 1-acyl-sn-glycerol-3-phosphate acyltransferase [Candidatus Kapabacteria bacterium]|nr:1-acyl-sn-glycerol-3-phosphate acyltransferase [Candidatus Kapabacteria bacterium]
MRTWLVIPAIVLVTIVFSVAVMVHMLLFQDRDVFFTYARMWSRILLRLSGVKVVVLGKEHLVQTDRYIYVSNHASMFDIPVLLAAMPDNIRIMYKHELERIPFLGWCLRMSPFIKVDRSRHREAADAIDETVRTFATGSSVVIFPEGTRSPDGQVHAFKRGAFTLAARSGRAIIPIAILGAAAILPARTRRLKPGTVTLHIMPPQRMAEGAGRADEVELMRLVHAMIAAEVNFAA